MDNSATTLLNGGTDMNSTSAVSIRVKDARRFGSNITIHGAVMRAHRQLYRSLLHRTRPIVGRNVRRVATAKRVIDKLGLSGNPSVYAWVMVRLNLLPLSLCPAAGLLSRRQLRIARLSFCAAARTGINDKCRRIRRAIRRYFTTFRVV